MANVEKWSTVAATNTDPTPDGAPEGHLRTQVNNITREMMAAVRRQLENMAWFDKTKGPVGEGFTPARLADDKVTLVHESTPTDATDKFLTGARIRVGDGSTYVVGYVTSAVFATPTTTVTIDFDGASVVQATPTILELNVTDGTVANTAFSPRGTTVAQDPPEVPAIDDLGDGVTLDQGAGNGFDADTLDGFHAAEIIDAAAVGSGVEIINGAFSIAQRGATIDDTTAFPNDNAAYTLDQWVLLMGSGTSHPAAGSGVVDVSTVDATTTTGASASTSARLTGNSNVGVAPVEKAGLIQWLPNDACRHLADSIVSVSVDIRRAGPGNFENFRLAVVEWTGTADTLTSVDPIDDWGVAGVLPTVNASYSVSVSDVAVIGANWSRVELENVSISSGMTNLGVLLYMDDTSWGIGDIVEFTGVEIVEGATAVPFHQGDLMETLHSCMRFFNSTFDLGVAPADYTGLVDGALFARTNSASDIGLMWEFGVSMFKTPTIATYNPWASGTTPGWFFNISDVAQFAAAGPITPSTRRADISSGTTGSSNKLVAVHATAEAVL